MMTADPLCISGVGIVSGLGIGGRDVVLGVRNRILASTGALPGDMPLADPDYGAYLGQRGLRHLSRGTLSLLMAAGLALTDAGLSGTPEVPGRQTGVAVGSATATAAVVADFDRTTLSDGPQAVNPALFPQTVWNSPSSQVAIRYGLHGANVTVCTGLDSGLQAVLTALVLIRRDREQVMLAGGFEELSPLFRVLFEADIPDAPKENPLSEGAVVLVLENGRSVAARRGVPLAELHGAPAAATDDSARIWCLGGGGPAVSPAKFSAGPSEVVNLYDVAGCGGGMSGALAAALAACGGGAAETVVSRNAAGRSSTLFVKPLR